ncbi:hypothetical protein CWI42_120120 [Ordospora colligata]|uniref:Uncharacterized protein n=1 Tax=Ordospora colligata OC4 TaxID=1354746 RepID=A0A0B2UIL1_9MICR|nr:uncharacterized protein M896_120120 [Ordospora colligata OC4]KHN68795.1 hypothetical protein M896_120120 [Ordospora colligata OC4]TBU13829.1 hypothetical protein CWI40_120120 [Ordospora colligata]TBU14018.1 hypothetical protein CWI41_120120 [Ordospora colligata]TBU17687.1 hypothetical protein CWI42_120120 [Ordospora colligata]
MDKRIEEVVKKNLQAQRKDLKSILKQDKSEECSKSEIKIVHEHGFVFKADSSKYPCCPIVEIEGGFFFYTVDGRSLMFEPNQSFPYIFLPFPLKEAFFYKVDEKVYFITLDTCNKLQYSLMANNRYPSEERYTISRNVVHVVKHANKVLYVSSKNGNYHVNMIVRDAEGLKGRMFLANAKKDAGTNVFYANSILFMNAGGRLLKDNGKNLCVEGDSVCGIQKGFLVLNSKTRMLYLLNENQAMIHQMSIRSTGQIFRMFSIGDYAALCVDGWLYALKVSNQKLVIVNEIHIPGDMLYLSASIKKNVIRIASIVAEDIKEGGINESIKAVKCDDKSVKLCKDRDQLKAEQLNGNDAVVKSKEKYKESDGNGERAENRMHEDQDDAQCFDKHRPYVIDKLNDSCDFINEKMDKKWNEKIDQILMKLRDGEERMNMIEANNEARFNMIFEMLCKINDSGAKVGVQEMLKNETSRVLGSVKEIKTKMKDYVPDDNKILECAKRMIIEVMVPTIEAAMDEIRVQMINEIRLMHDEDHLKDIRKAVGELHDSFTKQNEVKNLISEGLIEKAVEAVISGSNTDLDAFISCSEVSFVETLSSSLLVALFEKVVMASKELFKPNYQHFMYMIMVCLELNDLNDEEIKIVDVLMSLIDDIEEIDIKELPVILNFQRIKLGKVKEKRRIK